MKKNTLKLIGAVVSMVLTLGMFAGCSKDNSAKDNNEITTVKVNEVARSIFYAPMYAAISQGFFEEEGIKVELTTGQGADKTMQQLISGNVDIGFSGPEQVIYIYNQGRDDLPKVFAQLTQKDGTFLVAKDKHNNFSWEDIKGKKLIGGRPGGMPEMALEYVLAQKEINKDKDIELITNISFDAVPAAFLGGTGDYAALFEPSATVIANEVNGQIVASIGESAGNLPYTCFYALDSYIKDNKDLLVRFVRAIQKGQDWVMENDDATVAGVIKEFFEGTDEEIISTVVGNYRKIEAYASTPVVSEEDINRLMDIIQAYDKELITKRPPFDEIVDTTISKEAIK